MKDFWNGQKEIKVLDPNIIACREKRDLLRQYKETGAWIEFNAGLDIRLINDQDIDDLNGMKLKVVHMAWDNPEDKLEEKFRAFSDGFRIKNRRQKIVYVLTNFGSTMEQNLYRIYTLRDLGYDPFVMVYNKPNAPEEIKRLQRWCNNKIIFGKCKDFMDYKRVEKGW